MRPCVFLDRDGVVNEKAPEGEYITSWADFRIIPAVVDWIRLFNVLGYLVIVVTNQRAVSRGLLASEELERIHDRMVARFAERGARIDDVFYCPHALDSCECRKPGPGMVEAARAKWGIDLSRSLLIGDSEVDRQLAAACGLSFVEVSEGRIAGVVEVAAEGATRRLP